VIPSKLDAGEGEEESLRRDLLTISKVPVLFDRGLSDGDTSVGLADKTRNGAVEEDGSREWRPNILDESKDPKSPGTSLFHGANEDVFFSLSVCGKLNLLPPPPVPSGGWKPCDSFPKINGFPTTNGLKVREE
jgi:hypothetical protein